VLFKEYWVGLRAEAGAYALEGARAAWGLGERAGLPTPFVVGDEGSSMLLGDVQLAPLDRDETGAQPMEEISSSGVVAMAGVK
jgi:hypothetical protein